ncbi:MAG: MmgE/PrpD family protein, partial [Alphaproteobacteria bacterium]|nr:MmgE/PrpD family protein [Alphaproteobacteria bacterium]
MATLMSAKAVEEMPAVPAARALAGFVVAVRPEILDQEVWQKIEICCLDLVAAAVTARNLPWARQALAWSVAVGARPECTLIGRAARTAASEAAFVNAVAGHGLIREDMHVASGSHIGVAVIPAALAAAERVGASGADFACGVAAGYEIAGRLGRALIQPRFVQFFRPTGVTGPIGAAAAVARILGLDVDRTTSAIAFAANMTGGLNEWPRAGGEEIYLHAGMAARNGVLAAFLAAEGGNASETVLDGPSGLFAAFETADNATDMLTADLDKPREILAVFHKPTPGCNYAQTPAQTALGLLQREGITGSDIESVTIRTFAEARDYPGCDHRGPYETTVQAKMSLQFAVAAVLAHGCIDAETFERRDDAETLRLAHRTTLSIEPTFQEAYPGRQGSEIVVNMRDGRTLTERQDDLIPLSPTEV